MGFVAGLSVKPDERAVLSTVDLPVDVDAKVASLDSTLDAVGLEGPGCFSSWLADVLCSKDGWDGCLEEEPFARVAALRFLPDGRPSSSCLRFSVYALVIFKIVSSRTH